MVKIENSACPRIPNEICPKCGHHALEHVIIGPNGNGCQVMIGESERGTCGCLEYLPVKPVEPLIGHWETLADDK
jgi:hypothetical protein